MNDYKVYKHTTPNGKVYIGITSRKPEYRWNDGKGYKNNKHFDNAIKKYGWDNIKHEILYDGLEETQAKLMEISLIHYYKSNDPEYGYNITAGGDGLLGYKLSEEAKKKISISNSTRKISDESKEKNRKAHLGKKHTQESINKMKEKHKGQQTRLGSITSEETKQKISEHSANKKAVIDDKGNMFSSITKCANYYNKTAGYVSYKLKKGVFKYAA